MTFLVRTVKCDELLLAKELQLEQEDRKNAIKYQGKGPGSGCVAPTKALWDIYACIHRPVVSSLHSVLTSLLMWGWTHGAQHFRCYQQNALLFVPRHRVQIAVPEYYILHNFVCVRQTRGSKIPSIHSFRLHSVIIGHKCKLFTFCGNKLEKT